MLKHVAPRDVRLGMYIHGFDGRWLDHPFWRKKFYLADPLDLDRVHNSKVRAVVIDVAMGLNVAGPGTDKPSWIQTDRVPEAVARAPVQSVRKEVAVVQDMRALLNRTVARGPVQAPSAAAERAEVTRIIGKSAKAISTSFQGLADGVTLSADQFADVIDDIGAAMTNSRASMIGLTRLKMKDEYTYFHSVAVGALMLGLARELKLDESVVRDLALGGLLHDVGKMKVSTEILNKPGPLNDAEFGEMKRHPELGHAILCQDPTVSPIVLEVTLRHHERIDGGGYPGGLAGDAVSLYARIAAICDVFDALTSARAYKAAMPSYQAITMMANWEGQFDRDLLVAFMRSIGLYPAGLLVRLSSQRLAITLPPGRRAGRPRARVFHCAITDRPLPVCDVVVADGEQCEYALAEEQPGDWSIEDWPALRAEVMGTSLPHTG